MPIRLALIFILFAATSLFAGEAIDLRNDREGESYYAGKRTTKEINRALRVVPGEIIVGHFQDILGKTEEQNLCAFDVVKQMQTRIQSHSRKFKVFSGVIHYLRSKDEIDDSVVKILLDAHETLNRRLNLPKFEADLSLPEDNEKVQEMLSIIGSFQEKLRIRCLDEAYSSLYVELTKIQKVNSEELEALFVKAYQDKLLEISTYKTLERARLTKLESRGLGLRSYYQKVKSLRTQYPLRDLDEKSRFVASRFNKEKMSRRQHLLENYTDLQIVLMGNVIKKLRSRLESERIEIMVYDRDELFELIPLEPMERFRFAIKILRKEMAMLSLNTYFAGRQPSYIDLMTASYEIGIIPAEELEEIAGLQDIWNPKKTFWDKAGIWVRSFATMSTLVIPPPYGFIPALAVVAIEATMSNKNKTSEDNTSLF